MGHIIPPTTDLSSNPKLAAIMMTAILKTNDTVDVNFLYYPWNIAIENLIWAYMFHRGTVHVSA